MICSNCKHDLKTHCYMGRFNGKNIDQKKPTMGKCESFKRKIIIRVKQDE